MNRLKTYVSFYLTHIANERKYIHICGSELNKTESHHGMASWHILKLEKCKCPIDIMDGSKNLYGCKLWHIMELI